MARDAEGMVSLGDVAPGMVVEYVTGEDGGLKLTVRRSGIPGLDHRGRTLVADLTTGELETPHRESKVFVMRPVDAPIRFQRIPPCDVRHYLKVNEKKGNGDAG